MKNFEFPVVEVTVINVEAITDGDLFGGENETSGVV